MKNWIALLFVMLTFGVNSQEVLTPLTTNPSLYVENSIQKAGGSIDSTFIYTYSPLAITDVWDDFSVDKFIHYPPNYTDVNVTSQWYYHLMNAANTVPELPAVMYCDSANARHDSVFVNGGSTTIVSTYFTPHNIWVNDLNSYPVTGATTNLFDECYILIDSIIDAVPKPTQDTVWSAPNFVQDSVHVFFANMNNPNQIWINNQACRNYRFAVDPWSLGVATFDGVDSTGKPYDFGNANAQGPADYLNSKPINLLGKTNVYLQFLYQAEGHGNMPESEDSLIVDFWNPSMQTWNQVWSPITLPSADQWDTAYIAVSPVLLVNGFKFRIRNKASLSGALDHWHIDYVELYENPLFVPQSYKDLAIAYPLNSLLEDYTSVPWDHYSNLATPSAVMIDTSYLQVYNSDNTPTNVGSANMFLEISYDGSVQGSYNLPNLGAIPPWTSNWELGTNQFPFFVETNHTFAAPGNDTMAVFDVKINADADVAGSNSHLENDTTYMKQAFKNYYAYDDGSAEVGYGIQGSNSKLAYYFDAYEADTLTGVLMHFVPTVTDVSNYIMLLTVWDDNNGEPGSILYQDDYFIPHNPQYGASKNEFKYYKFLNPDYPSAIPVPKKFYVGWEQVDSQTLNVGMDRNIVNSSKIMYNVGGTWITSSQPGSLMIRPVFSTAINYTLGNKFNAVSTVNMYPNPSSSRVNFNGLPADFTINLFDLSGRLVKMVQNESSINVEDFVSGIYLVNITDKEGVSLFTDKLIKE